MKWPSGVNPQTQWETVPLSPVDNVPSFHAHACGIEINDKEGIQVLFKQASEEIADNFIVHRPNKNSVDRSTRERHGASRLLDASRSTKGPRIEQKTSKRKTQHQ